MPVAGTPLPVLEGCRESATTHSPSDYRLCLLPITCSAAGGLGDMRPETARDHARNSYNGQPVRMVAESAR
jgi:hypothetical protein